MLVTKNLDGGGTGVARTVEILELVSFGVWGGHAEQVLGRRHGGTGIFFGVGVGVGVVMIAEVVAVEYADGA